MCAEPYRDLAASGHPGRVGLTATAQARSPPGRRTCCPLCSGVNTPEKVTEQNSDYMKLSNTHEPALWARSTSSSPIRGPLALQSCHRRMYQLAEQDRPRHRPSGLNSQRSRSPRAPESETQPHEASATSPRPSGLDHQQLQKASTAGMWFVHGRGLASLAASSRHPTIENISTIPESGIRNRGQASWPEHNTAFAQSPEGIGRKRPSPPGQLPGDRASAVPFQLPQMRPVRRIPIEELMSEACTVASWRPALPKQSNSLFTFSHFSLPSYLRTRCGVRSRPPRLTGMQ